MTASLVALALAAGVNALPPERFAALAVAPVVRLGPEVGVAVAVLHAGRETYLNFGKVETPAGVAPPTPDTLFEIGSITKAFTGVLFAEALERGEVKLGDTLAEHLPPGWAVRESAPHRPVTLLSLATHTSGLPAIPLSVALAPRRAGNPYADLTPEKLRAQLAATTPGRAPGARFAYSNLGAGLLADVLVRRAGAADFDALVRARIAGPLGLADTAEALTGGQRSRLAAGRDAKGKPTPGWDFATLAGCGALHSTTRDLVAFSRANLGEPRGPLTASCGLSHPVRLGRTGLLWVHLTVPGTAHEAVWHNGGTGGYRTMLLLVPAERFGVVVLANVDAGDRVDRTALALARKWLTAPKAQAPPAR